jgi:ribosome-associated toxin RatA of RatAB toxin-antitoxin module
MENCKLAVASIQISESFLCLVSCLKLCNARELCQRIFIRVVAKMAIQIEALTEQFRSSEALKERIHT